MSNKYNLHKQDLTENVAEANHGINKNLEEKY